MHLKGEPLSSSLDKDLRQIPGALGPAKKIGDNKHGKLVDRFLR